MMTDKDLQEAIDRTVSQLAMPCVPRATLLILDAHLASLTTEQERRAGRLPVTGLPPCPCCGGRAEWKLLLGGPAAYIRCSACGVQTEAGEFRVMTILWARREG